jgi:ribosomal protein L11 methylase PrmA
MIGQIVILIVLVISFIALLLLIFWLVMAMFLGAPFVPTDRSRVEQLTEITRKLKCRKAVDLGSGDGRILVALAKAGVRQIYGYEINPFLVVFSRLLILNHRLGKRVRIISGNYWRADLRGFDLVIIYGLPGIMSRLRKKLSIECHTGRKLISIGFPVPEWKNVSPMPGIYLYYI